MTALTRRFIACAITLLASAGVSAQSGPPVPSDDCIATGLALLGTSQGFRDSTQGRGGIDIFFMPGVHTIVIPGKGTVKKKWAWYFGTTGNGRHSIGLYPSAWVGTNGPLTNEDITNCSPAALAFLIACLAHETFHGPDACPGHGSTSGATDCSGIAIDIGVAGVLCDIVVGLNECICDPNCPPMNGPNGQPVPGIGSDEDACALAGELCNRHKEIADRRNSDEGKKEAATCGCQLDDGMPGHGSRCPDIPTGDANCPPNSNLPDGGFGPGLVVPPCAGCPPCSCP